MSFNTNDTNTTINLGNYEEYFILYMDNELNTEQVKMVEAFLLLHPDLQAELELLLSTKLPAEDFSMNKEALLAASMKMSAIDEELLLYIDNELPVEKKKILELELASNKQYQLQHQLLLQTRLDATEVVVYPNKEELYHRTERVLPFKLWMRIAAVVLVMATMGVLYFTSNDAASVPPQTVAEIKPTPKSSEPLQGHGKTPSADQALQQTIAVNRVEQKQNEVAAITNKKVANKDVHDAVEETNAIAANTVVNDIAVEHPSAKGTTAIDFNATTEAVTASFDPSEQILNTSPVTSVLSQRNTINATATAVPQHAVASDNEKGSFKSFFRKATRLIERKTGIEPANDNDELLIGAVALKLN